MTRLQCFRLEDFMKDTGCPEGQAMIAAETFFKKPNRPKVSYLVKNWNPDGPERHIEDYFSQAFVNGCVDMFDLMEECNHCTGTGEVLKLEREFGEFGTTMRETTVSCPICKGDGYF